MRCKQMVTGANQQAAFLGAHWLRGCQKIVNKIDMIGNYFGQ